MYLLFSFVPSKVSLSVTILCDYKLLKVLTNQSSLLKAEISLLGYYDVVENSEA